MPTPNIKRNAIGAGLLALDLILQDAETAPIRTNVVAGGSCGNVLAVLAYLGWNAYPVAQLGDNAAATMLCQDLVRWGVKIDFINKSAGGVTPLIIHRIDSSRCQHRFEFRNPQTQEWLPRFRPFTKKYGQAVSANLPQAAVFYFDRATPANLLLAEQSRAAGALVVFEPSASKDKGLFERALALAHLVKFSQQRLPYYPTTYPQNQALLEIQTQGSAGLVYRMQATGPEWAHVPAFPLPRVVDTAGAGDWCTAGIIDQLLIQRSEGIPDWFSPSIVAQAIQVGQAYGTINCCFAGARGAMYHLPNNVFRQAAAQLPQELIVDTIARDDTYLRQFARLPIQENTRERVEFYELLR